MQQKVRHLKHMNFITGTAAILVRIMKLPKHRTEVWQQAVMERIPFMRAFRTFIFMADGRRQTALLRHVAAIMRQAAKCKMHRDNVRQ